MPDRERRGYYRGIEGIPNDIKEGQLEVISDAGVALIPVEDLSQIMVHGANIRLSTMDLSILSQNKVSLMTLDENIC